MKKLCKEHCFNIELRNYELVHAALVEAGREDLIGFGPRCLIKPRGEQPRNYNNNNKSKNKNSSSKSSGRGNKKDDSRGKRGNKDSRENNSRNNRNEKNERNNKTNKIKRKKR